MKIGGDTIGIMTYKCMRRLMTNKLAVLYSFTGQKKKGHSPTIAFKDKLMCKLIISKFFTLSTHG